LKSGAFCRIMTLYTRNLMTYSTDKVTRVEIIDQEGRSYVNWDDNNKVELSFQDDGRTLKVFISNREEK